MSEQQSFRTDIPDPKLNQNVKPKPRLIYYKDLCEKGSTGRCPGWIYNPNTRSIWYCHDRMCDFWADGDLKDCPCKESRKCKGNHWEGQIVVCNRRQEEECLSKNPPAAWTLNSK